MQEKVKRAQNAWELIFESKTTSRHIDIEYLEEGYPGSAWKISNNPSDEAMRFPVVRCRFVTMKPTIDILSFRIYTYHLENGAFIEMAATFLKGGRKKKK